MILISKYRAALMGFSILWIMFFHSKIIFPDEWLYFPLEFFKSIGYAGVEIFFLLSGLGLVFSLEKSESLVEFYKRRVVKIVPLFLMASVVMYAVKFNEDPFRPLHFVATISGVDLLLGAGAGSFFWFIPALLLFYFFSPLLYRFIKTESFRLFLLLSFVYFLFLIVFSIVSPSNLIWYIRLPVFILGLYVGSLLYKKQPSKILGSLWVNVVLALFSCVVIALFFKFSTPEYRWATGLWWYPTVIMAYPLTYCISYLFDCLAKFTPAVIVFFSFIGSYTFELYLTHSFVYKIPLFFSFDSMSINIGRVPEYLIYMILSLVLSIFVQKLIKKYT